MRSKYAVAVVLAATQISGCSRAAKREAAVMTGGNPDRGAASIASYGCGSCHSIPGISAAHGIVGPPLAGIGTRMYVAGVLPNQPGNLEHWIRDPHSINEDTVMPTLGVTPSEAVDIAAYLYSLK